MRKIFSLQNVFVSTFVLGSLAVASLAFADKYEDWKDILPKVAPHPEYEALNGGELARSVPSFNGRYFFIDNWNKSTYRFVNRVQTKFDTRLTVTTNVSQATNILFDSAELFTSAIVSTNTLSGDQWIAQRSSFLQDTFSMPESLAYATAVKDRSLCESSGMGCSDYKFQTGYDFVNFDNGPTVTQNPTRVNTETTPHAPVTTVTQPKPNTTVRTTVSGNTTTTTTTTSETETISSGTIDRLTYATDAHGGTEGTVTTDTQEDTRTFVDSSTTEDTTTETRNETRTDTETTRQVRQRQKRDRYWDYDITPLIFFDFQFPKKIVSMNSYYPATAAFSISEEGQVLKSVSSINQDVQASGAINQEGSDQYPRLTIAQQDGPFRVELTSRLSLGVGAALSFHQVNARGIGGAISPYVGLAPLVGKSSTSERTVVGRDSIKHLSPLKLPSDKRELANWKLFDKLTYSSTGGLLFIGGASLYGFTAGVSYVATGSWSTEVQKVAENRAYVKIASAKLKSLGVYAGAGLVGLSTSKFKSIEDSFSFLFDLNDPIAEKAFTELLKGHAQPAQMLADDADRRAVVRVETSTSVSRGRLKNLAIGIPFIGWTRTKGQIMTAEASDFHPLSSHLDADYGIYMRDSDTQFLGYNSSYTYGFYGAQYDNRAKDGVIEHGLFGQIGWSYHTSQGDYSKLVRAVDKLVKTTGMQNELYVEVPKFKGNIGYASIEFSMRLDAKATHLLMALATESDGMRNLQRIANGFVDAFFRSNPRAGSLTADELCGGKSDESCARKYKRESQEALADMQKALGEMNSAYVARNRKAFVKAYATFGKAMLVNPFTFQTIFNTVKGRGVTARYSITGQEIPAYDLSFEWKPQLAVGATSANR